MSLKLILGPSGSGKTALLQRTALREAEEHPERKYLFLVPEQFTMQTQQQLCRLSASGGVWNIDILSFSRLAQRVFEQTGVPGKTLLKETGKSLILRHIASQQTAGLSVLSGVIDRPGCLDELKSILSELEQYEISGDMLETMALQCQSHPALQEKLRQIREVQSLFLQFMKDHYITAQEVPAALCRKAPEAPMLRGSQIFLDGYTGFTPAQLDVLAVLMRLADKVTVTVTADPDTDLLSPVREGELFALSKKTGQALVRLARQGGTEIEQPLVLTGKSGRFREEGILSFLEKNLMRPGRRKPWGEEKEKGAGSGDEKAGGKVRRQSLEICSAPSPFEETQRAASMIRKLAAEGFRYREIAVVVGSLSAYSEYVRRVFEQKNIPCFLDRSVPVTLNPAFEFVQDACTVIDRNYSYESVTALLRTGLLMETDRVDELENYVLAAGIRGRRAWSSPWSRRTRTFDEGAVQEMDQVREEFWSVFGPFHENMKKGRAPVREYARAVWLLMEAAEVPGKLEERADAQEKAGRMTAAEEYRGACRVIVDVLDEAVMLLGDEEVSRSQFEQILQAGFSQAKIGIVPPGIDEVHVGDLTRSRWDDIRVLIFLGMNDEYVPARKKDGGFLTDMEREFLNSRDIHLAPTKKEEAAISRFYLYLCLTKPSERLILSFSQSGADGKLLRPSSELRRIRELFPDIGISAMPSGAAMIWSADDAFREMAVELADWRGASPEKRAQMQPSLLELIRFCLRSDRARALELLGRLEERPEIFLSRKAAAGLYGTVLSGSVTRLETFFRCPYQQYILYGMRLREREKFEIDAPGIGTLMHLAAELFSERICRSREYSWSDLPDDVRDSWAGECLQEAADQLMPEVFRDSARNEGMLLRLRHQFSITVWAMQRQIAAGSLTPALFEVRFDSNDGVTAMPLSFSDGAGMRIAGRIDRIDESDEEGQQTLYIRVIDYKTGSRTFDMTQALMGTQMQLLVYLDAAGRIERDRHRGRPVVCAGLLYDQFQDPVLGMDCADCSNEDLVLRRLQKMRLQGIINRDEEALSRIARDKAMAKYVAPLDYKSDGTIYESRSKAVTAGQMDRMKLYVRHKMTEGGERILGGEIAPRPLWEDQQNYACLSCSVEECCPFDRNDPSARVNRVPNLTADEAYARMEEALGEDETGQA